ncbi:ABC-2 type transport system permease protein [Peribacillus deserti]|uniref:ABC-2 type transport system permease protein n=1 Tax=Peribacillus deserti TaxID=673318 RepID=A0ABS2QMW8_9BACI|nr:ABC transporter permease [Peribacillus deserti]MBM7694054.1 ABC-2 type transport system permease protein [Peribacillus deserti]
MNKFWIIFWHTFTTKIKAKSFIVSTVIMMVLVLGATNMAKFIQYFEDKKGPETIGVVDESGEYYTALKQQLSVQKADFKVTKAESEASAGNQEAKDKISGYLLINEDGQGLPSGVYKSETISDSTISSQLQSALQQVKGLQATQKLNLKQDQIASLYEPVQFDIVPLKKDAKTQEELNQARGLVYIILFVIYFSVLMYGNMIAMEVAQEKTSRVMEILVSSVSPVKQMFAKIFGIALLSISQLALFFIVGYASFKKNLDSIRESGIPFFNFDELPVATIFYGILFAILGYFLYATLAAFLGSLVSRVEDLQQTIGPMTWLVVIGFTLAMFGLGDPELSFIKIMSFIPFFSPMLMFLRVGMLEIPIWEVLLSVGLLIVTIIVLAIFGARVYKGGVLLYGKSSSFKDIKKALSQN